MENTVPHPAPRQRTVRHRVARALTPARRETGAEGGGDGAERGRPTDRREQTAARGPGGCDHASTTPGARAIARARPPRDELLAVEQPRGGRRRYQRSVARASAP